MHRLLAASAAITLLTLPAAGMAQVDPGELLFKQRCKTCHSVAPDGKSGVIGPNLRGVVGRAAASGASFKNYSPALMASKLKWGKAELDKYLTSPTKAVPGTRMVIAVPDAKQRATLINWLATQK